MEEDIYSFQHFGFTAKQIILERKHLIGSLLEGAFKSLIKKATQDPDTTKKLEEKENEIMQNIFKSFDKEFEGLAGLDVKYFQIPDNMLLAQDFDHLEEVTEVQVKEVNDEIEKLNQAFLENNVFIKSLEQQEEQFELIKPYVEKHLKIQEKAEAAINVLKKNKISHIQSLLNATRHVADQMYNDD